MDVKNTEENKNADIVRIHTNENHFYDNFDEETVAVKSPKVFEEY